MGWVGEGILKMVLVVEAGMEDMVGMDITTAILLRVVPHMGILIYPVNLVVAVEIVAWLVQLQVVALLVRYELKFSYVRTKYCYHSLVKKVI